MLDLGGSGADGIGKVTIYCQPYKGKSPVKMRHWDTDEEIDHFEYEEPVVVDFQADCTNLVPVRKV